MHPRVHIIAVIGALLTTAPARVHRGEDTGPDMSGVSAVPGPDEPLSGGATTVRDSGIHAFGRTPNNMSEWPVRWPLFRRGKLLFDQDWEALRVGNTRAAGPLYNNTSCLGCHFRDGRGAPPESPADPPKQMVFRLGRSGDHTVPDPMYGDQLSLFSAPGLRGEGRLLITYEPERGAFADGHEYELLRPRYQAVDLKAGPLADGTHTSARVAPAVFGMGLLQSIPESAITAHADPDDRDLDGISGRPNYVLEEGRPSRSLGRFGWKALQPTVKQQVARALLADMGIRSRLFPDDGSPVPVSGTLPPEISEEQLAQLEFYTLMTAVPARRNWDEASVLHGKGVFTAIGCASCHVSSFMTGNVPGFPELSNQRIHPYTDLLLHDMGPGLADGVTEGLASGSEWRTPPLWGIGLLHTVNGHTRLLHDGRARDPQEAIVWHGGEAQRSRDLFVRLAGSDRAALLAFLESL